MGCFAWLLILIVLVTLGACGFVAVLAPDLLTFLVATGPSTPSAAAPRPAMPTPVRPGTPTMPPPAAASAGSLSAQQKQVYDDFGWPHSFSLAEVDDAEGKPRRHETWTYLDAGMTYVFVDGGFRGVEEAPSLPPGFRKTPYRPDTLSLGMPQDAVRSVVAEAGGTLRALSLANALSAGLLEETEFYVARQMVAGFHRGRLTYLEAVALAP
jgi:hypothetical protein